MKARLALLTLALVCALSGCAAAPQGSASSSQGDVSGQETASSSAVQAVAPVEGGEKDALPEQSSVSSQEKEEEQLPAQAQEPAGTEGKGPVSSSGQGEAWEGYFDQALFVGDSIMEGIRQYVMAQRKSGACLGEAQFLTTTMGISVADLVGDRQEGVSYSYKGQELPLADILEDMAPRRVFLLLGLNDLSLLTQEPEVPRVVEQYDRLIALVESAVPGAQVVVISNPPKLSSSWLPDYTVNQGFDNQLIGEFVTALGELCREKGVPYVDAYALLADESGALPEGYCRDGYVHLNNAGAKIVVDALYQFASQEA